MRLPAPPTPPGGSSTPPAAGSSPCGSRPGTAQHRSRTSQTRHSRNRNSTHSLTNPHSPGRSRAPTDTMCSPGSSPAVLSRVLHNQVHNQAALGRCSSRTATTPVRRLPRAAPVSRSSLSLGRATGTMCQRGRIAQRHRSTIVKAHSSRPIIHTVLTRRQALDPPNQKPRLNKPRLSLTPRARTPTRPPIPATLRRTPAQALPQITIQVPARTSVRIAGQTPGRISAFQRISAAPPPIKYSEN